MIDGMCSKFEYPNKIENIFLKSVQINAREWEGKQE